jgi:exopolysaccharide biosynthesis polyprenyl glycosylphosphotransferase
MSALGQSTGLQLEPDGAVRAPSSTALAPVRILHIATRHRVGGAERNLRHTVATEIERGFEVDVAVGLDGLVQDFAPGARVHSIPELVRDPSPRADARALQRLRELIHTNDYDVVHTHQSKAGALGRLAARDRARVILHTVHMASFGPGYSAPQTMIFRRAEQMLARCTDRCVFVGRDVMRRYVAVGAADPDRSVVIPSPIPNLRALMALRNPSEVETEQRRRAIGVHDNRRVILAVAALDRRKRHAMMISALAPMLAAGDAVLVIVGEGPERNALEQLCTELEIREAVQFRGFVDDVAPLFAAADLFVHTSTLEGVSQSVVQAVAAGVPIVATEVDGLCEAALGEPHVTVLPRDGSALADTVGTRLHQPRPIPVSDDDLERWLPTRVDAELTKFQDWVEERVHICRSAGVERHRSAGRGPSQHRRASRHDGSAGSVTGRRAVQTPTRRGWHLSRDGRRAARRIPYVRTARGGPLQISESDQRRLLALSDVCAVLISLVLASSLALSLAGSNPLQWTLLLTAPAIVGIARLVGLYDRDRITVRSSLDEVPRLLHVTAAYTLGVWLLDGLAGRGQLSHSQALVLWLSSTLLIPMGRAGARAAMRRVARADDCLFIGDTDMWERFRARCAARGDASRVVHFPLRTQAGGRYEPLGVQLVGAEARLRTTIARQSVRHVVVAVDEPRAHDPLEGIMLLRRLGAKISVIPNLPVALGSSPVLDDFDGMPVVPVRSSRPSRVSLALKRSLDIVVSVVGLILLAPLFAVFAAAVKLGSPGPVFFHQDRVGRNGRIFRMHKFRTMIDGAHEQRDELKSMNATTGVFKLLDDGRVTRPGRFLRRSSLDELPQLWNVLRGEMSLVGPRPLIPEEDQKVTGWGRARLDVLPGMTGEWQVMRGLRVPLDEMVMMDYLYISNWSLWADVKALLRTIPHIAGRRGL